MYCVLFSTSASSLASFTTRSTICWRGIAVAMALRTCEVVEAGHGGEHVEVLPLRAEGGGVLGAVDRLDLLAQTDLVLRVDHVDLAGRGTR